VALYQNPSLLLDNAPVVSLGAYECVDDFVVSRILFYEVLKYTRTYFPGSILIGPMEGSTWQTYRFVTSGMAQPPFLFEPFALSYYPAQWREAGFKTLMEYHSNLAFFDESDRADFTQFQRKFEEKGLVFRKLDVNDSEGELLRLAKFNLTAFQSAFLYSAISEEEFVAKNRKLIAALSPELVHLALQGDTICGMILGYPDKLDPSGQTAVVKTLARLSGEQYRGLGDLLCARMLESLLNNGYKKMIHALIRSGNASHENSSRFFGETYKNYTLFQIKL
jgi:L-amino acid N-acyltransferase YncA